jgi:hypothetical protein
MILRAFVLDEIQCGGSAVNNCLVDVFLYDVR